MNPRTTHPTTTLSWCSALVRGRTGLVAGLALACAGFLRADPADLLVHPDKLRYPAFVFTPPQPTRHVLKNGIVVHALEDHELPVVQLSASARGGHYLLPDDKNGIDDVFGTVMRTGGTRSIPSDALDEELEFMSASVWTSMDGEQTSAGLNVLSKNLDRGLEIFADVVMHPAFDPRKIDLRKQQVIEGLRRWNDEPSGICAREFRRLVYPGHPFGRVATVKTVSSITQEDLLKLHERCWYPDNVIMAISGDFETAKMIQSLESLFAGWKPRGRPNPMPPEVEPTKSGGIYYLEKETPQVKIRMGHVGIKENDPDYFALDVMDSVLGGNGASSRLYREVRSNRGLAYSVGSFFSTGITRGQIGETCGTNPKTAVAAIELMRRITSDLRKSPPSQEELKTAKDSLLQSYAFRFRSADQIVRRQAGLEFDHLPADWVVRYQDRVSRVTAEDVRRVAEKLIHMDRMILVVVGNEKEFDKRLSTLGPVTIRAIEDFEK